jgi:hypothetical protein
LTVQRSEVAPIGWTGRHEGAVVVEHRADDRKHPVAGVNDLHQPSLARPVDDRAGGDFPESAAIALRAGASRHLVGMGVAVQPQHDVVEAVQQLEDRSAADRRTARMDTAGPRIGEGVRSYLAVKPEMIAP